MRLDEPLLEQERDRGQPTRTDLVQARLESIPALTETRGAKYGHPSKNHQCTADMWSAWVNRRYGVSIHFDVRDVCEMNLLQKTSRQANVLTLDNDMDRIGYIANAWRDEIDSGSSPPP